MSDRNRYDDTYDDGLGMDALIGRDLKNYADRVSPPADMRQQILSRAQEHQLRPTFMIMVGAYFRTLGRLLWLFVSLRWLEAGNQDSSTNSGDWSLFTDYTLSQWFYHRSTMNAFLYGSGNFTLSG
jgi:hypothetical protein